MRIVGIDPGKNGAVVTLDDGVISFKGVTPLIGKELDIHGLAQQIRSQLKEDTHVFVEQVHAVFLLLIALWCQIVRFWLDVPDCGHCCG